MTPLPVSQPFPHVGHDDVALPFAAAGGRSVSRFPDVVNCRTWSVAENRGWSAPNIWCVMVLAAALTANVPK